MKKNKSNIIDISLKYLFTSDLKKLWHFYLFIIIFNTWLELALFNLYRLADVNLNLLLALVVGLIPIYAFSIYCIKFQAINKKRPYWIIPFLIVLIYVFLTPNPNAIGFPQAHPLVKFYADNCLYLVFLTALRILMVLIKKRR
jgi:hypothetical protein